jgi:hypothetical protein
MNASSDARFGDKECESSAPSPAMIVGQAATLCE